MILLRTSGGIFRYARDLIDRIKIATIIIIEHEPQRMN